MWLCDIVDDEDSAGSLVVDFAERFVSFLSCGVPKGDFDVLVADLDNFGEEFYSYGGFLRLIEFVADVSGGDVGFAGSGGADHHYFEHLIVLLHGLLIYY